MTSPSVEEQNHINRFGMFDQETLAAITEHENDDIPCTRADAKASYWVSMRCCHHDWFQCARHHIIWVNAVQAHTGLIAECKYCHNVGALTFDRYTVVEL